jgi:hypothetical protein
VSQIAASAWCFVADVSADISIYSALEAYSKEANVLVLLHRCALTSTPLILNSCESCRRQPWLGFAIQQAKTPLVDQGFLTMHSAIHLDGVTHQQAKAPLADQGFLTMHSAIHLDGITHQQAEAPLADQGFLIAYEWQAYLSPTSVACDGKTVGSSPDWHALSAAQYAQYKHYVEGKR